MPDILSPDDFPILVGSFHGGQTRGPCIQLTTTHDYVQLTMDQVNGLRTMLDGWHDWHALVAAARGVIKLARRDLGQDMTGLLDLLADNFPSEPLDTLGKVLHELGED